MSRHLRAGLIFLKLALLVTLLNVQHVKDLPAKQLVLWRLWRITDSNR